jgi:hypothetical protein
MVNTCESPQRRDCATSQMMLIGLAQHGQGVRLWRFPISVHGYRTPGVWVRPKFATREKLETRKSVSTPVRPDSRPQGRPRVARKKEVGRSQSPLVMSGIGAPLLQLERALTSDWCLIARLTEVTT